MRIKSAPAWIMIAILLLLTFPQHRIKTSFSGKVIRWSSGEGGAMQNVNDSADLIISRKWQDDLERLADTLISTYALTINSMEKESFTGGYLVPVNRIPKKYLKLGGSWSNPDIVLKQYESTEEAVLIFSWGHMRHSIQIFSRRPIQKPSGWYIRQIGARIFVGAKYS